jgi:hypothetical protein
MPREVKIVVKGVRKKEPDLRKLARALIQLAIAQEEAESAKNEGKQTPEEEGAP